MKSRWHLDIVDGWERISEAYQQRYSIPCDVVSYGPMCPGETDLQLLGSVMGRRVLDIGCGGGQNSIALARQGAHVMAVDPSASQLRFGMDLAARQGVDVNFVLASAEDLVSFHETFDIIISCYSLMFVEDIVTVFSEIQRLLAVGGIFVVSVDHPIRLSGEWNQFDQFVVSNYFQTGWQNWSYEFPERTTCTTMYRYHRTFGQWMQAIISANLQLTEVIEPLPPAEIDQFGRMSRYGLDSPRNVFHVSKLARVPGTLLFKGCGR